MSHTSSETDPRRICSDRTLLARCSASRTTWLVFAKHIGGKAASADLAIETSGEEPCCNDCCKRPDPEAILIQRGICTKRVLTHKKRNSESHFCGNSGLLLHSLGLTGNLKKSRNFWEKIFVKKIPLSESHHDSSCTPRTVGAGSFWELWTLLSPSSSESISSALQPEAVHATHRR